MFGDTSADKRKSFLHQTDGCYIPGYTGHCPTLRFHYGASFGSKTKEIISDLGQKRILNVPCRNNNSALLHQARNMRGRTADGVQVVAPRFIIGYTGFIPNMTFRSGKSYGRTADDCMNDFHKGQRSIALVHGEINKMRSIKATKLSAIRNDDNVAFAFARSASCTDRFKERDVSPEFPPIAGYTGYVPKVKGNEESLSQRYNNVVKRSLTLLKEERDRHSKLSKHV